MRKIFKIPIVGKQAPVTRKDMMNMGMVRC
jgi:hypothetical protein